MNKEQEVGTDMGQRHPRLPASFKLVGTHGGTLEVWAGTAEVALVRLGRSEDAGIVFLHAGEVEVAMRALDLWMRARGDEWRPRQ